MDVNCPAAHSEDAKSVRWIKELTQAKAGNFMTIKGVSRWKRIQEKPMDMENKLSRSAEHDCTTYHRFE